MALVSVSGVINFLLEQLTIMSSQLSAAEVCPRFSVLPATAACLVVVVHADLYLRMKHRKF